MARPRKKTEDVKGNLVTLRLSDDELAYLDAAVERIRASAGLEVSRSAATVRLILAGKEPFERQFPIASAKKKQD